MERHNSKGFTLAELLIVVAIIGILVAISIPIFSNQLEKSRDAVTAVNIRNAYSTAAVAYINEETTGNAVYIPADSSMNTDPDDDENEWTVPRVLVFGVEVKGLKDGMDGDYDWPFMFSEHSYDNQTAENLFREGLGNQHYHNLNAKYVVLEFYWKNGTCYVSVDDQYGDDTVEDNGGSHIHSTDDFTWTS